MSNPLALENIRKLIAEDVEAKEKIEHEKEVRRSTARRELFLKYYHLMIKLAQESFVKYKGLTIEFDHNRLVGFGDRVVSYSDPKDTDHILDLYSSNLNVSLSYDTIEEIAVQAFDRAVKDLDTGGYRRVAWSEGTKSFVQYSMPESD